MITQRPLSHWIFHRYRLLQLLLFGLILLGVGFRVFPLEMQRRIVNTAIELGKVQLLFIYCGYYLASVILAGLLKYGANVLQRTIGQRVLVEIRHRLYDHILTLPLGFFRKTAPGTVVTAMSSELNFVGQFLGGALAVPVTSALTLLAFAGYMIHLNPLLGLVSLSVYPFELILVPMLQHRYNRYNVKRIHVTRSMNDIINEAVSGIHEIQGNAGFGVEREKIGHPIRHLFDVMKRLFAFKYGIKFVNNFFQNLGPFILFLIGGYLAIHGEFTLGALVAFLSAYEKVYEPWKELIEYYQEFQDARVRYYRVMETFDAAPEFALTGEGSPERLRGEIEVEGIDYTVEEGMRLLDDISLHLEPGRHLALVGFSGSGKSTLAMLLGQLYLYRNGHIRLDGRELKNLAKTEVGSNVGFIAQHPFIFNGSIKENLLYACRSLAPGDGGPPSLPDRDEIRDMVHTVGLADDIVRLGLNTPAETPLPGPLMGEILRMRTAARQKLVADGRDHLVEFYDVNGFMNRLSIFRNIVFGELRDPAYRPEESADNREFLDFLDRTGLTDPLASLGRDLAVRTVSLLKDVETDDFFFRNSPIAAEELDDYQRIVNRLETYGMDGLREPETVRLLIPALRYVPVRHKMAAIPAGLRNRILTARHRFMAEKGGIDMDRCRQVSDRFIRVGNIPAETPPDAEYAIYCPENYLHSRPLLDNIIFGTPRSDDATGTQALSEMVIELLQEADLLDAVMGIGLDFQVGSKGDRLSGGQKQKIAIARALLKKPPILIMDEATASLDNVSQRRIQAYIEGHLRGKTTVAAVLHRLDMTPGYDQIMVLKGGRVMETGDYESLMAQKGAFYDLVEGTG